MPAGDVGGAIKKLSSAAPRPTFFDVTSIAREKEKERERERGREKERGFTFRVTAVTMEAANNGSEQQ